MQVVYVLNGQMIDHLCTLGRRRFTVLGVILYVYNMLLQDKYFYLFKIVSLILKNGCTRFHLNPVHVVPRWVAFHAFVAAHIFITPKYRLVD